MAGDAEEEISNVGCAGCVLRVAGDGGIKVVESLEVGW